MHACTSKSYLKRERDGIGMMSHYHNLILNKDCFELYNRCSIQATTAAAVLMLKLLADSLFTKIFPFQISVLHLADPATSERE